MTIIPLAITNCSVVELLLQVFALVYGSYGERHCITSPNFLSIVRSFVLILTRNNGSELKTGQGGVEIISNYAWGISMTVH